MCFAPQRHAFFRHLNVQKWSEHVVLLPFWLGHVLRAPTACTFSTSQLPKVVRSWCVLYILTWKCASHRNCVHFFDISTSIGNVLRATTAFIFSTSQLPKVVWQWCVLYILTWKRASRHNGVQFFISHLASLLRARRFSKVAFRPSRATYHWKNTVSRDLPTFSRTCLFFLLWSSHFLSSPLWLFPPLLFHLSILLEVWLLKLFRLSYAIRWYNQLRKLHLPFPCRFNLVLAALAPNICRQMTRRSHREAGPYGAGILESNLAALLACLKDMMGSWGRIWGCS